jgi:hypothetical protein
LCECGCGQQQAAQSQNDVRHRHIPKKMVNVHNKQGSEGKVGGGKSTFKFQKHRGDEASKAYFERFDN